jgi:hypothetical protein
VILEEVWIFIEIDRLKGKPTETFAPVSICSLGGSDSSTAEFGPGSILVIHDCLVDFAGRSKIFWLCKSS